jgi:mono/diheme cytochrome c family protein
MRERLAAGLSVLAIGLLALLSVVFAATQNRGVPPDSVATPTPHADVAPADVAPAQDSVRGRQVFQAQGCERCHSVEGVGSPRYPLDGVGSRRGREALRDWTVAGVAVVDSLSPSAARAKRRYAEMPAEEMDALLSYMQRLVR